MSETALAALQACFQKDVNGRGLDTDPTSLFQAAASDFSAACRSLADAPGPRLAIVTGFYIPHGQPPAAETDGPLGALFLARALTPLGISVVLVTDAFARAALELGLALTGLRKQVPVVTLPSREEAGTLSQSEYAEHVLERTGPLTHLLALERAGPSHFPASVREDEQEAFLAAAPSEYHDRCHNMSGKDISALSSPAHRLFEALDARTDSSVVTLGIGDGGNEIGMGKIPWSWIRKSIRHGDRIACRVATDYLIVAGVSNWGAYGLAAGVRLLRRAPFYPELFDAEQERSLLQSLVERGPLVDGVTGLQTATVDGLPFEQSAEVLAQLGQALAAAVVS
jgi:hypothetical protein